MKIIRYGEGGRHPKKLRHQMQNFFEDPFMDFFDSNPLIEGRGVNVPKIDVSEDSKELKIVADIPGYKPDDVEIELNEGSVVLKGKTQQENMEEDEHFFRRERSTGEFYREIPLPPDVDGEKAEAKVKNGTLTITVPKTGEKEKKTLKIKVED